MSTNTTFIPAQPGTTILLATRCGDIENATGLAWRICPTDPDNITPITAHGLADQGYWAIVNADGTLHRPDFTFANIADFLQYIADLIASDD